jgi:hypothetical protein
MNMQSSWTILLGIAIAVSGCENSPVRQLAMNAEQIKVVPDENLCVSVANFATTDIVKNEAARRKLDCIAIDAAREKRLAAEREQREAERAKREANERIALAQAGGGTVTTVQQGAGPISCGETKFSNLTNEQGKALKFVLEQKAGLNGIACFTEITAHDKFPLRGQTVVKYSAKAVFPRGYKANCLAIKDPGKFTGWSDFGQVSGGCNPYAYQLDPIGKPARLGEVRVYTGEEII